MLFAIALLTTADGSLRAIAPDLANCDLTGATEQELLPKLRLAIEGELTRLLLAGERPAGLAERRTGAGIHAGGRVPGPRPVAERPHQHRAPAGPRPAPGRPLTGSYQGMVSPLYRVKVPVRARSSPAITRRRPVMLSSTPSSAASPPSFVLT